MKLDNLENEVNNITWYNIDTYGYIEGKLHNKAAVYIYAYNLNKKFFYYIGSTINLAARISSHRCCIHNLKKDENINQSSLFYKSIIKHGWTNFQFGVLEYINLSFTNNNQQKKEIILEREQFYLDNINPSLNSYKVTNSSLGTKRDYAFSVKMSKARRGKGRKWSINNEKIPKIVTDKTKSKISLNNQGINVKVFDKFHNLIHEFSSIRSTAKFFNVDPKTINNIYKTGISFDEFIYKFEAKDTRIFVYDIDHTLINIFDNTKRISLHYNIPSSTLSYYIKFNKLYKNKFFFYKANYNILNQNC